MITWMAGPAVSLKGSPTVSPVTAALCCSLPFSPRLSISYRTTTQHSTANAQRQTRTYVCSEECT